MDRTPPVIASISGSYNEAQNRFEFSIAASDSSGIDFIYLDLTNPLYPNTAVGDIKFAYDSNSGLYTGFYDLPEFVPDGIWAIDYLTIGDKVGNFRSYTNYDSSLDEISIAGSLEIDRRTGVEGPGDQSEPVITSLELSYDQSQNRFVFSASGFDESGIDVIYIDLLNPVVYPKTSALGDVRLTYDDASGNYNGYYALPEFVPNGTWSILDMTVWDNAGNFKTHTLYPDPSLSGISLTGSLDIVRGTGAQVYEDRQAPTLASIESSYDSSSNKFFFRASAADESGISDIYLSLVNPLYPNYSTSDIQFVYDSESGDYLGSYSLPEFVPDGTWSIGYVSLWDKAGNFADYDAFDNSLDAVSLTGSLAIKRVMSGADGSGESGGGPGNVSIPNQAVSAPAEAPANSSSPSDTSVDRVGGGGGRVADSTVLGIQPQETVTTVELTTPLTLGDLQVTKAVVGTAQRDVITGSDAGEALAGGEGKDQMTGGGGPDAFLFETPGEFGKKSRDTVTDFNPDEGDKVVLAQDVFDGVKKIKLDVARGKKDAKNAASSKKNFIYDEKTGILYFNENGKKNGWGDGGEFVKLLGAPDLGNGDLAIV